MKSLYLALGYECNQKCITCPCTTADKLHSSLMRQEIDSFLKSIHDWSDTHITISGGEPTINPNFTYVLSYLTRVGAKITILTNASMFADEKYVSELIKNIDIKKTEIVTAIHSSNPTIHDTITGIEGSLFQTISGLNNLYKSGLKITIKVIPNKLNYKQLGSILGFIADKFPPSVGIVICGMDYTGRAEKNIKLLGVSYSEISNYLEPALDYFQYYEKKRRKISIFEMPLCALDPVYWDLYENNHFSLDVYAAPNADTATHSTENTVSLCGPYYPECQDCDVSHYCHGVWRSTYRLIPNIIHSVKENKND